MAIEIAETFQVKAPVDAVWRFMSDPHQVVTCMPGAQLEEVVDDPTFLGSVKVKLGAITTRYKGGVQISEMDPQAHTVKLTAEGRETGGAAEGICPLGALGLQMTRRVQRPLPAPRETP